MEKGKTAITELIEKAEKFKQISETGLLSIDEIIKELYNILEKEKIQIIGAYDAGCVCGYIMTSIDYYEGQYEAR